MFTNQEQIIIIEPNSQQTVQRKPFIMTIVVALDALFTRYSLYRLCRSAQTRDRITWYYQQSLGTTARVGRVVSSSLL